MRADRHIPELINFLPPVYREGINGQSDSLKKLYRVFQQILLGEETRENLGIKSRDGERRGLLESVYALEDLFHPGLPFLNDGVGEKRIDDVSYKKLFLQYFSLESEDFINWMSSWVDLSFQENWGLNEKSRILQRIIPLYRKKGTEEGITEFLKIYLGKGKVKVVESDSSPFEVGHSRVGESTILGGGKPYHFTVEVKAAVESDEFDDLTSKALDRLERNIRQLIELQKPAHTTYDLLIDITGWVLGQPGQSEVEQTTLLGIKIKDKDLQ